MFCSKCGEKLAIRPFTPREKAVFGLMIVGLKNSEIAKELSLTEGTVKVYISHMYDKLGCSSKYEMLKWHYEGRLGFHVCQPKTEEA